MLDRRRHDVSRSIRARSARHAQALHTEAHDAEVAGLGPTCREHEIRGRGANRSSDPRASALRIDRDARPAAWTLEGFAQPTSRASSIAARALAESGVAAW